MTTKKPLPCDGSAEQWAFIAVLACGLIDVIELMVHHGTDWLTYTVVVVSLALLWRHHRTFHQHQPVEAPEREKIR
jgi:hypothetical protein